MENSSKVDRFIENYKPYRGLPPLAGIASFREAMKPGLSVEESVYRLKRHHYAFRRLHQIFLSRISCEPIYELKMAFSYHAHLCAEAVALLRARVGEMREPPLGLDKSPDLNLEVLFDEILCAPDTSKLLLGIYEIAVPKLLEAMHRHIGASHVLADQPTRRLCRIIHMDIQDIAEYGGHAIEAMVTSGDRENASTFIHSLTTALDSAGGLDASAKISPQVAPRFYSRQGFVYDSVPVRDARFPDPYNMGVNAEVFLYDEKKPSDAKILMMFYKRLREIDVPEMMAGIIIETPGKPWEYYRDMTRQLWDEARHAMMGEVGFVSLGIDWGKLVMVNFTFSYMLNTQLQPRERHAILYFIEQGLMPKTGKRHEWEVALMSRNPLAATFQDFDWADEVLHARVGRDWYVKDMPSPAVAVEYGDQCWNKITSDWKTWKEKGLTEHRNWWPDLYRAYCENFAQQPDAAILAFAESYEGKRADQHQMLPME